ncbi:GNAT family N-acetyltransferase [Actinacidiphila rubida]|uniref:Acetyltransferase (GNAT) domain-containing protein n=1 Tax=Actinacidiphila rubida TaxID=310780 RepID=A0A1H8IQH2_9ACTN|nr:GNAT family N-acetyltransferase [Actinacidiphila rubida]SEN70893.1 Acetyltransferase (GNAT) domain-containing protein [Actinacidiphila rubida]
MILRPVRDDEEDAETVRMISSAALGASRTLPGDAPAGGSAGAGAFAGDDAARQRGRTRHLAATDPGGCWIAQDEEAGPLGAVLSSRREGTWAMGLLAVLPGAQGKGVGKALMARSMAYGTACLRGVVWGPPHPVAARTYRRAGFTLHPAMALDGVVDPSGLAPLDGAVHPGTPRSRDMMDSVDRRTRGGAHGPDHEELLRHHRLLVVDDLAGSGYCYVRDGVVELLAATSRRLATRLLTAALLTMPQGRAVRVSGLTAEQEWAVDVGIAAGLSVANAGYVCLRGMRPPSPYLPSPSFL